MSSQRPLIALCLSFVTAFAGLVVTDQSTASASASALPAGFSIETISTALGGDDSYELADIKYVQPTNGVEGGLFGAGKSGAIAWNPDGGRPKVLATVPNVRSYFDNGMVGITPAFDYARSGRLYVIYNTTSGAHSYGMVASWLVNSVSHPTAATFEKNVLDGVASGWIDDGPNHQVGDVVAWPDGTLFISQGDGVSPSSADSTALWAQDVTDPHGKIMHIRTDGQGVANNPYFESARPNSWKSSRVRSRGSQWLQALARRAKWKSSEFNRGLGQH